MYKWWVSFHASFHDSETIFWARVKVAVGSLFTAVQTSGVDVAALFTDNSKIQGCIRIFMAYLMLDGGVSEWLRRRNATDLTEPAEPTVKDPL